MEIVSGDDQSGVVGTELTAPLIVRVLDSAGTPVSGQLVNFVVTAGGGHVFAGASITNSNGQSQERWTLGTSTADSQRVEARAVDNVSGQPITFAVFRAVPLPGPPDSLKKVSGDGQAGQVGAALPDSLVVKVLDHYGNAASGIAVTWTMIRGGGSVSPSLSSTDAAGLAGTQWTPGDSGADSVHATVTGVAPVSFSAAVFILPVYVTTGSGLLASCGLAVGGSAWCWGDARYGALGNPSVDSVCDVMGSPDPCSLKPLQVVGGLAFDALGTGGQASCGLSAGKAYCWGSNFSGLLGNGTWSGGNPTPIVVPTAVAGGLLFSSIAVGTHHVCALTSAGAAYCWGADYAGALGTGSRPDSANAPAPVIGGLSFLSVAVGSFGANSCGIATGGAAYCWGAGSSGQLGTDSLTDTAGPVPVSGGLTFVQVSTGQDHTCGVATGGAAYCWGPRALVGDTVSDDCKGNPCSRTPHLVAGGLTFSTLSAGFAHTCGLTTSGAAYCWGIAMTNGLSGSVLGDGTTVDRLNPVPVAGGHTFVTISASVFQTCAVTNTGDMYCWGSGLAGELGDGTTLDTTVPVKVTHP